MGVKRAGRHYTPIWKILQRKPQENRKTTSEKKSVHPSSSGSRVKIGFQMPEELLVTVQCGWAYATFIPQMSNKSGRLIRKRKWLSPSG